MLKKLCKKLEIPFFKSMLSWSSGPKKYDGIWGAHWYKEIYKTKGFRKSTKKKILSEIKIKMTQKDQSIIQKANKLYFKILEKKI